MSNTVTGPTTGAGYSIVLNDGIGEAVDLAPVLGVLSEAERLDLAKTIYDNMPTEWGSVTLRKTVTTVTYVDVDLSVVSPEFTIGE